MTEQKPCVRCGREIDRYARLCVYCNWDQSQAPSAQPQVPATPPYVPPVDKRARNRVIGIIAVASLIVIAFVVGTLIHGFEPNDVKAAQSKPAPTSTAPPGKAQKSNVTLVPATDTNFTPDVEAPITSAPPQAPGQQPNDATALPSDQYAAVAAKAKAERDARNAPVDPRTVRGRAFDDAPPPKRAERAPLQPSAPVATAARTEAYPEYKPLPDIRVDRETSARLILTVGADGRVKDVDIAESIPGETAKLLGAVQNWRFRPATENGIPVPARVAVTITLHSNG